MARRTRSAATTRSPRHSSALIRPANRRMGGRPMLDVERLETFRGAVQVLRGVSLRVDGGESIVLVGRNGAGKTTTIETIMGLLHSRGGTVTFRGTVITRLPAYRRMGGRPMHDVERLETFRGAVQVLRGVSLRVDG